MTPALVVTDHALARLAGHAARGTPGVVRLHRADPQIDRDADGCTLTVAITARTEPPVLEVIDALQQRVTAALADLADTAATVRVHVLDVQTGG